MVIACLQARCSHAWYRRVREACVRIFEARNKHLWPPTITVYGSWRAPYREMAREEGFGVEEVDDAALHVIEMIAQIDAADW